MQIPSKFDGIRPYTDEELPQIFEELLADETFRAVVESVMPQIPFEIVAQQLRACKTSLEVQKTFFHSLMHRLIHESTDGFRLNTQSLPDKNRPYTFISNHRDIVLDPSLVSVGLLDNGFPTTVEIAIGDNLLIYPWIEKLVRVNKSFIVQRALSMRQMLQASATMSEYIHFAIREKRENIWIAQREGRAKDSNDRTQESVLKMLAMGGEGDVIDRLKALHIVPLALSYEYDPCDYLKAMEFQLKRDVEGYKKTQADDLLNMKTGIYGYKGRVNFVTAPCLDEELEAFRSLPKTEVFTAVAQLIDRYIHRSYVLYPCNYIAVDLSEGGERLADRYTAEEKEKFLAYVAQQLARIDLPHKDEAFLRTVFYQMYAYPALNQMAQSH